MPEQVLETEEPTEEVPTEKVAFSEPAVFNPEKVDETSQEAMKVAATEVLNLKQQGYEDEEIVQYIQDKYGFDRQTAEVTLSTIMQYIQKKAEERHELRKQALGMLPTLAQSDNPFAGVIMQSLIEKAGLNREESFVQEIMELQREMMKAKLATEMMKDVMGTEQKPGYDPLMVELIKSTIEEKKQAEERFMQLLMAQAQGARAEEINQLAEIVRQSIEALNQKIEAILTAQANSQTPVTMEGSRDIIDEMTEFSEKLKRLQEAMKAMGFEIKPPGSQDPLESLARQQELQMKMKELELREKEAEAKQVFYSKLAEALSNPQTLQTIFNGLNQLFNNIFHRGAPTPRVYQGAMVQAAQVPTLVEPEPVKPPADIPSLDEFLEGAENAGTG
ncbi:MAG: hypothetical protein J7K48_08045 [Thermococcus sp.]|nr:hypothetical protein [Thermococcus sp.]